MSFENNAHGTSYNQYLPPVVEIKDGDVMINGKNFFDQPINDKRAYDNIWKIAAGQRDDYTTDCLLDYVYFKNYDKMIAIDLRKQQDFDTDPRANQKINFTGNLDRAGNTTMFFITK